MKTLLALVALLAGCHPAPAQIVLPPIPIGEFLVIPWEQPPGLVGRLEWSFDAADWHRLSDVSAGSSWTWQTAFFPASFGPVFFRASYTLPPAFALWPEDAFPEAIP